MRASSEDDKIKSARPLVEKTVKTEEKADGLVGLPGVSLSASFVQG